MDFVRRLAEQLREVWAGMSAARRALFVVVALLLAVLVGGVFYYRAQTDWAVLYTNLTPDDEQAIRDRLQTQGVPVRTSGDHRTIEVPADRVGSLRIDLAGQGLPAQAKGYELFDEPSLGSTPFQQNVNLLRAKQAVLAKTIRQLEPVANATVEIARPEPSPFLRERQPTTAAVQITLRPSATLTRAQVNGIVAFVARAVEGLTPENVTVVDSKGNQLSEPGGPDAGAVASQLDYRRAVESYLSEKAQAILIPALGSGRAVVKVTADINFQHRKEVLDTINPEQKALKNERTTNRNSTTTGGGARGIAGAQANLGQRQGAAAAGGTGGGSTSTTKDEESEASYDYTRTHTELDDKLGAIKRLTVAATVDLTPAEGSHPPLTQQAVEGLIKGAIGFDEQRGDTIQVTEAKLATAAPPPAETATEAAPAIEWWRDPQFFLWVRNVSMAAAVALLGLIVVLIAVLLVRGNRGPARIAAPAEAPVPGPASAPAGRPAGRGREVRPGRAGPRHRRPHGAAVSRGRRIATGLCHGLCARPKYLRPRGGLSIIVRSLNSLLRCANLRRGGKQ
jgi:flagellar M-ring protein FliF